MATVQPITTIEAAAQARREIAEHGKRLAELAERQRENAASITAALANPRRGGAEAAGEMARLTATRTAIEAEIRTVALTEDLTRSELEAFEATEQGRSSIAAVVADCRRLAAEARPLETRYAELLVELIKIKPELRRLRTEFLAAERLAQRAGVADVGADAPRDLHRASIPRVVASRDPEIFLRRWLGDAVAFPVEAKEPAPVPSYVNGGKLDPADRNQLRGPKIAASSLVR